VVKRLDLSSLVPILHAVPAESAPEPVPVAPAGPSLADLLGIAAGDAPDRATYFDTNTQARGSGPALITSGATLLDYRDVKGKAIHHVNQVLPPSTARRIAAACGGRCDNLTAALIALAEHGIAALNRDGATLFVRSAPDPHRADRIAARRGVLQKRRA
jgi:hypothetical protein